MSDEENLANANLIAAAPELLAACKAIVRDYEDPDTPQDNVEACRCLDANAEPSSLDGTAYTALPPRCGVADVEERP